MTNEQIKDKMMEMEVRALELLRVFLDMDFSKEAVKVQAEDNLARLRGLPERNVSKPQFKSSTGDSLTDRVREPAFQESQDMPTAANDLGGSFVFERPMSQEGADRYLAFSRAEKQIREASRLIHKVMCISNDCWEPTSADCTVWLIREGLNEGVGLYEINRAINDLQCAAGYHGHLTVQVFSDRAACKATLMKHRAA